MSRTHCSVVAILFLLSAPGLGIAATDAVGDAEEAKRLEQVEADANTAFGAGDWKAAQPLYETVTEAKPEDGTAWFRLGLSTLESGGSGAQAVSAYRKAIELGYPAVPALFGIARSQARAKAPETLVTVAEIVALGPSRGLAQRLETHADFEWLQDDPRFLEAVQQLLPCTSAAYRQFDFWIGDWDVETPQGQLVGHNLISSSLDGCMVVEEWTSQRGHKGLSLNYYDDAKMTWTQIFRDNSGVIATWPDLVGGFRDGSMILESDPELPSRSRWTWTRITEDKVRQMAESSTDGGKTWAVTWDSYYIRRAN
jgi:hypothetical protein